MLKIHCTMSHGHILLLCICFHLLSYISLYCFLNQILCAFLLLFNRELLVVYFFYPLFLQPGFLLSFLKSTLEGVILAPVAVIGGVDLEFCTHQSPTTSLISFHSNHISSRPRRVPSLPPASSLSHRSLALCQSLTTLHFGQCSTCYSRNTSANNQSVWEH